MFFVFSKDKIVSYLISLCMVVLLLGIAFYVKESSNSKTVTSNNVECENNNITLTNQN